jgi:hypothetical protein
MTSTSYTASFADTTGRTFYGAVYWDKHHPQILEAKLCPALSPSEAGYPIWTASTTTTPAARLNLIKKLQTHARTLGMALVAEKNILPAVTPPEPADGFSAFEVHPCVQFDDAGNFHSSDEVPPAGVRWHCERCAEDNPHLAMWSVYGHSAGLPTWLSDHKTKALALADCARLEASLAATTLPLPSSHCDRQDKTGGRLR